LSLSAAIANRDVAQLPSRRDEDWRWTDLRALIRVLPEPSPPAQAPGAGPFDSLAAAHHVVVNGRGPATVSVAPGQTAAAVLRFVAVGAGSHAATAEIVVGKGASLLLLESYESDGGSVSQATLSVRLEDGATLDRIVLARDDAEAVSVSQAQVSLSPSATFRQFIAASGARRQRLETHVAHPGSGATLRLDGVYLLADKAHSDQTSVVTHAGTDGVTEQLAKGVVRDQARAVFQGRIVVSPGADRTDARMGHHALVLSDLAEVDSKPELEIYADDVSCAHGNTVGALDADALFYARQRGIPEAEAYALLTQAFIGEVIDRIVHDGAREIIGAWAAERLRV